MPIYSYHCKKCGNKFDLLVGVTSDSVELICPRCGNHDIEKTLGSFSFRMGSSSISNTSSGSCSSGGCCPTC